MAAIGPVDFRIAAGRCLGLTGPSGAGKTRILRAIADLEAHTGVCAVDGEDAAAMAAHAWRRRVSYVAADSAWWHDRVGPHLPGIEPAALAALGFAADVVRWPVARLSSGERQRLALLRHLAQRPDVLLLDEPTAHLDARNAAAVVKTIEDYRRRSGAAVVWVDHDRDLLIRVADQRAKLDAAGRFGWN